jgi:endonuclease
VRLIVARCQVSYAGRLSTVLPEAVRLLMIKADGTFMVFSDGGGANVKPLNWMVAPTVIEEHSDEDGSLRRMLVQKRGHEERLEVAVTEVLSEVQHELDTQLRLEKEGMERELQELLAAAPQWCGEGFRLVRREWPTDIGPVDLMCRDTQDEWIAVEIKRVGTIDAVEQLTRYLDRIRLDPALGSCRGVLAAQTIKPQARVLAASRGIACVEVDREVLRGEREPDLKLFAA